MMPVIHYPKAPITEALIDLQVERLSDVNLLKNLKPDLELEYPACEDIYQAESTFQVGTSISATAKQSHLGYRFFSNDKKQVLQARLDGFTYSRLAPYDTWKSFRDEAQRLWELYRTITQTKRLVQVAVRYINRLDLPLEPSNSLKIDDYLRTRPKISPDLPQNLSNYFMQVRIPQADLEAELLLNEAIVPAADEKIVSVLLDIGLFKFVNISADDNTQWNLLEEFRDRKNEVFEACITDKTRELFKQ
jgi:uncharacterized protein (TIGR04255 family)